MGHYIPSKQQSIRKGDEYITSEIFYALQHFVFGCPSPQCNFIHTQAEIKTEEFRTYLKNHAYYGDAVELYPIEARRWDIQDVIKLEEISGWTPRFILEYNGFEQVGEIDLYELFDGLKYTTKPDGTRSKPWHPYIEHNLCDKKDEIERILEKLNYKDRDLVIFRTTRGGLANWDAIGIYFIGNYHSKKEEIRQELTSHLLKGELELEEEKKRRLAEKEAEGIKPIDWDAAKKRLEEYIKEKNPRYQSL